MQDCSSILDTQQVEQNCTEWVQSLHKKDILTTWTLNECLYFLLLSPTTQKKVGGLGAGETDGTMRLMVIQRITILLSLIGIDAGPMPYRTPRGLGQVYGSYETVQRILLADFLNRINSPNSGSGSGQHIDTSAGFINDAVEKAQYKWYPSDK